MPFDDIPYDVLYHLLLPVFEASEKRNGYINIDLSPKLAYDAVQKLLEAER